MAYISSKYRCDNCGAVYKPEHEVVGLIVSIVGHEPDALYDRTVHICSPECVVKWVKKWAKSV